MPIDKLLIEYLLVPSVIAIIFIYIASDFLLRGTCTRIKCSVSIILYIVLVYSGFYGVFASFAYSYVLLFLIIGVGLFFLERLIAREWISGGAKGAGILIKKLKEKAKIPSENNLRDLVLLYNQVQRELQDLEKRLRYTPYDDRATRRDLIERIDNKNRELRTLVLQIDRMVRSIGGINSIHSDKLKQQVKNILEEEKR